MRFYWLFLSSQSKSEKSYWRYYIRFTYRLRQVYGYPASRVSFDRRWLCSQGSLRRLFPSFYSRNLNILGSCYRNKTPKYCVCLLIDDKLRHNIFNVYRGTTATLTMLRCRHVFATLIGLVTLISPEVIQSWLNLLECCISHVIFEFRNPATMIFNSFEKFLETPGVLVRKLNASFYGKRTMNVENRGDKPVCYCYRQSWVCTGTTLLYIDIPYILLPFRSILYHLGKLVLTR